MNLKVILNAVHPISPFVYGTPAFIDPDKKEQGIVVPVSARANSKAVCSRCGKRGGIYDTSRETRHFEREEKLLHRRMIVLSTSCG